MSRPARPHARYARLRSLVPAFENVGFSTRAYMNLRLGALTEHVGIEVVSASFFATLGGAPP